MAMSQFDPNPYASPSIAAEALSPAAPIHGTIDYPLASRGRRLLGAIIDSLILVPLAIVVWSILAAVFLFWSTTSAEGENLTGSELGDAVVGLFLGGTIFIVVHGYLLATRGQTVGKYLLKMQIVSDEGRLVSFWRLITLRYLPFWLASAIPGIGGVIGLANALAIFRESRRCLHDDFAGTKVIQL